MLWFEFIVIYFLISRSFSYIAIRKLLNYNRYYVVKSFSRIKCQIWSHYLTIFCLGLVT